MNPAGRGMYQVNEWYGKSRMAAVREYSIKALNVSSRNFLGRHLDPESKLFSKSTGIQQDWQGLADLMGFDYEDIRGMVDQRSGMTKQLLDMWSTRAGTNIGQLLDFLEQQERFDILEDDIFQRLVESSVDSYVKRQKEQRHQYNLVEQPVQVHEVDSQEMPVSQGASEYSQLVDEELTNITINERDGKPEFFDAFICYTHADIVFVKQVIAMLENRHGLKLCIPDRDVIPGCAKYTVLSHLISKRCSKMVIIVSRKYLMSDECDFMTKFGHSLAPGARNKKLIPVLIDRGCEIPDILRYITLIDYTKCELVEWFWFRLARALQEVTASAALLFSPMAMQQANEQAQAMRRQALAMGVTGAMSGSRQSLDNPAIMGNQVEQMDESPSVVRRVTTAPAALIAEGANVTNIANIAVNMTSNLTSSLTSQPMETERSYTSPLPGPSGGMLSSSPSGSTVNTGVNQRTSPVNSKESPGSRKKDKKGKKSKNGLSSSSSSSSSKADRVPVVTEPQYIQTEERGKFF